MEKTERHGRTVGGKKQKLEGNLQTNNIQVFKGTFQLSLAMPLLWGNAVRMWSGGCELRVGTEVKALKSSVFHLAVFLLILHSCFTFSDVFISLVTLFSVPNTLCFFTSLSGHDKVRRIVRSCVFLIVALGWCYGVFPGTCIHVDNTAHNMFATLMIVKAQHSASG